MIMTRVRTTGIVVTEVKEAPFTYQGTLLYFYWEAAEDRGDGLYNSIPA
jgi:hypothetical protein